MKIDILTLFPEMFSALKVSMLGKAEEKGILDINTVDIRNYTLDKHNRADDYPFGGGVGMLMMAEPIFRCLESVEAEKKKIVYMSPKGKILNQETAERLSKEEELVILCGHYEGIDQRVLDAWDIEEISIGDYILTGGDLRQSFWWTLYQDWYPESLEMKNPSEMSRFILAFWNILSILNLGTSAEWLYRRCFFPDII